MRVFVLDDFEMFVRLICEEFVVVGVGVVVIIYILLFNVCFYGVFQKFDLRRIGFNDLVLVRLVIMFLK